MGVIGIRFNIYSGILREGLEKPRNALVKTVDPSREMHREPPQYDNGNSEPNTEDYSLSAEL